MIWPAVAILGFVTLQRLVELPLARRNTAQLLAKGGYEVAPAHYPLIVALHAAWLGTLWWFAPGQPIHLPFLGLFAMLSLFGAATAFRRARVIERWQAGHGGRVVRTRDDLWIAH